MKHNVKRIFIILMSVVIMFSTLTGCDNQNKGSAEVVLWTISSNEKVLRDEVELYQQYHENKTISVFVAKNEKESGQFTITTLNGSVSSYSIEISDLKSDSGNTFSKENIELFNQKYYMVGSPNDYYRERGMYPDALLPFDTAVKYGENKIEEKRNQSITVRFDVPEDQIADVYKGSLKVVVDGAEHSVPINLAVYDATVSEEVHSRSSFSVTYSMEEGEFDFSMDKKMAYLEFLAEYFVSGSDIYNMNTPIEYYTDEGISLWVKYYKELYNNPKVSSLKFPILRSKVQSYQTTMRDENVTVTEPDENKKLVVTDVERSKPVLQKLLKACVEDNTNYISKLYFRGLDEPNLVGSVSSLEIISDSYQCLVEEGVNYAERLRNSNNAQLIDELVSSLRKVPIITTYFIVQDFEQPINYCPSYNNCKTEADINEFIQASNNQEMWWYGCNSPSHPYPTFHVDDILVSSKVVSWMQYDYGILGNLYWAVDWWESNGERWDYYDVNTMSVNEDGEGLLVYPGEPYGLDTPVASVRLEAIRDGLEEYEILRQLDLDYKSVDENYSIDPIYEFLSESLYSGAEVVPDITAYETSRKALYELSQLSNVANFGISDVSIVDGVYSVEIFADSSCEIISNGNKLTAVSESGSIKKYVDKITLGNNINGMNYSVSVNGKSYSFSWVLGSSSVVYTAEQLDGLAQKNNYSENVITGIKTGSELGLQDTNKYILLGIEGNTDGKEQRFKLSHNLLNTIGEKTKVVVLSVYYDPENDNDTRYMKISAKFDKYPSITEKMSVKLEKGMNVIEINMATTPWKKAGEFKYFDINYSESSSPTRQAVTDVYLKSITIMDK